MRELFTIYDRLAIVKIINIRDRAAAFGNDIKALNSQISALLSTEPEISDAFIEEIEKEQPWLQKT